MEHSIIKDTCDITLSSNGKTILEIKDVSSCKRESTVEKKIHNDLLKHARDKKLVVICIGTDRVIADAYAPYIGSMLEQLEISDVYGTLSSPIHALNIGERLEEIYDTYKDEDVVYLSIDACLIRGSRKKPLTIEFRNKPIEPGKGVGKELGSVGDFSIVGFIGYDETDLRRMRLSEMIGMADDTVEEILKFYELRK